MSNLDQIVSGTSNTKTDTGAISTQLDLLGKSALVLALVASVLVTGLDVISECPPSLIETSEMTR